MTMQNLIGQKVTVTLRNFTAASSGPFGHLEPKTFDLVGTVMLRPHWEHDSDYFALAVPHTVAPLRMIHIRNVVAINGIPMVQAAQRKVSEVFAIKSSRGKEVYEVKRSGSFWTCTCVANTSFRKICRHIKEARGE